MAPVSLRSSSPRSWACTALATAFVVAGATPGGFVLPGLGGAAEARASEARTSGTPPLPTVASGSPCGQAPASGSYTVSVVSGGRTRQALVHIPPSPSGASLPVLFALHGANQDAAFFEGYTGYSTIADGEGFVAVYPDVGVHRYWTISEHHGGLDDVRFVSDLLDRLQASLCLDSQRVYATGVSNGGGMAARLACDLSTRIAAVAPVAGGYRSLPACRPANPVSVLEVHGTADPTVPYRGSGRDGAGAVAPFLSGWVTRDACAPTARRRRVSLRVLRYDWSGCGAGSAVAHLEVFGGAHQLPGALPHDRGPRSTFSAPWQVWRFLRDRFHAGVAPGPADSNASAPRSSSANR